MTTSHPDPPSITDLTADEFRDVIGHFASGVTVITATDQGELVGTTASAVCSVSLEPPILLVCMNRSSATGVVIERTRAFAVNILSEGQGTLSAHFAGKRPDKFAGVARSVGQHGQPLLTDALAHVECEVIESVTAGTHTVFLAKVNSATARRGLPLAYYRGKLGRIELSGDETAYALMREALRNRPGGDVLDVLELAAELDVTTGSIASALEVFEDEGSVRRRPGGGYIVVPSEVTDVQDLHEARCIIELGVAERTVGRTSPTDLVRLRRAMELTKMPGSDELDSATAFLTRYVAANAAFHETVVGLARSHALLSAYRREDPSEMLILLDPPRPGSVPMDALAEDHEALVEAYERGDLAAAREVIIGHAERAKAAVMVAMGEGAS